MKLSQLYPKLNIEQEITGITNNPYMVKPNYIFVLTNHNKNDHLSIKEAIKNKACLIISNKNRYLPIPHIKNKNPIREYIRIEKIFYRYKPINTISIIGNNGNIMTRIILSSILNLLGDVGTINSSHIKYLKHSYPSKNPFQFLIPSYRIFNNHDIKNIILELNECKNINDCLNSIKINNIIFTNLEYRYSLKHKKLYDSFNHDLLFENKKDNLVVINADDLYSNILKKHFPHAITYGINNGVYTAKNIDFNLLKTSFDVYYKNTLLFKISTFLFGTINIYHILSVVAYCYELGLPDHIIYDGIHSLNYHNYKQIIINNILLNLLVIYDVTPLIFKKTINDLKFINKNIISIIQLNNYSDIETIKDLSVLSSTYSYITIFVINKQIDKLYDIISNIKNNDYYICANIDDAIKLISKIYKNNDVILIPYNIAT